MKQPADVHRDLHDRGGSRRARRPTCSPGSAGANCKQEGFHLGRRQDQGDDDLRRPPAAAGKSRMEMDGTYSADESMDMNMKMTTEAAGMSMTIEMRMTGRRVGDCPAGKAG